MPQKNRSHSSRRSEAVGSIPTPPTAHGVVSRAKATWRNIAMAYASRRGPVLRCWWACGTRCTRSAGGSSASRAIGESRRRAPTPVRQRGREDETEAQIETNKLKPSATQRVGHNLFGLRVQVSKQHCWCSHCSLISPISATVFHNCDAYTSDGLMKKYVKYLLDSMGGMSWITRN